MSSVSLVGSALLVVNVLLCICGASGQGFADITQLSGVLSGWATLPGTPSRGCVVGYELSTSGTSASLALLPCDTSHDAALGLSGYEPVIGLLQASPNHSLTYAVLADFTFSGRPLLLATFNSLNGLAVSALPMGALYDPQSMQLNSKAGLLYIVARQPSQPSTLFVLTVDPTRPSWSTALITAAPVVPNSILPLGASLLFSPEAAYLPLSGQLVVIVGSGLSASLAAVWHLLVINPATGSWVEIIPSTPAVLSASALSFTTLGFNDVVLISTQTAAWVFNVSAHTFTPLMSVTQHVQRADIALGCGQLSVAIDVASVVIPSSNSSVPFVALVMYAQPTLLSAVQSPFWYLLYVDTQQDLVTYASIDTPPLFFDQLLPAPDVLSMTSLQGVPHAYNASAMVGAAASLLWSGSNFVSTSVYTCVSQQAVLKNNSIIASLVNSSALTCFLPAGWANTTNSTWVAIQLIADDVFVLYQSRLRVVMFQTGQQNISASAVPTSAIGRMMASYSVASSLTPLPVISSSSVGYSYATAGTSSPLQLHSQLTRGLTFITQQLQTLTTQPTTASQVLPAIQSALTHPSSSTVVGLNDAYALFASAADTGTVDFSNMASSVVGMLAQDASSLPQLLSGLSAGSASTLALDLVGAQAQDWLSSNLDLDTADPTNLEAVLGLGVMLPQPSSTMLSQLTSLGMNSALQLANSIPVLSDVLDNPTVADALNLPDELSSLIDDPTSVITDLLPGGALKDTVLSFLGDDDISFSGSLGDVVSNVFDNLDDTVSNLVDTAESIGSSFLDDIFTDAVDAESGSFAGPIGSMAGMLSGALGAGTGVQEAITTAVSVVGGVAEIFCGDVVGGIGDIISGFSSLFGGSKGPDETQVLTQQMTADFNQVLGALSKLSQQVNTGFNAVLTDLSTVQTNLLNADQQLSNQLNNGFSSLSNLTLTVYANLQQQQYNIYQSEMSALATVASGVGSIQLTLAAGQQQMANILAQINVGIDLAEQNARRTIYRQVEVYMTTVQQLLQAAEQSTYTSTQARVLSTAALSTYQNAMSQICAFTTIDADTNAADPSMTGDPSNNIQGSWSAKINQQPNYDLSFALLPSIISSYLGQTLPSVLQSSGNLPNPLAYAFAANFWLEARQAAMQSPSGDTTCLPNLWQVGQRLQVAVRMAVSYSALQALVVKMNAAAAAVMATLKSAILANYPTSVPSSANIQALITELSPPNVAASQSVFTAFDDACAVASLLLTIGQNTGLGSNGFTNGYVSSGASGGTSGPSVSFTPGQTATHLSYFSPVTSSASFTQLLTQSLNLSLAGSQTATPSAISAQRAVIFQQAGVLLNWTTSALQNAVAAFYPPCYVSAATAPNSLPVIDTTLRRLAGFMMQTRTRFFLQGYPVLLPPPLSLSPVAPLLSANLCLILYSLPGNIDYPWSSATSIQFVYNPTTITTIAGKAVTILSGTGSRTYTNRFGASFTTTLTITSSNSLLYLGTTFPVDGNGLRWNLSSPVQLPGAGPAVLSSLINVVNLSGAIVEAGSSRVDGLGQAFLSSVPGFNNITIGASNTNSLAASYATCQAPITFTNGLRTPTQPTSFNGGIHLLYTYFISDGTNYSVATNLTLTTTSAFATTKDQLGNPYQTVVNITGTRTYTYLPTGATETSIVTGLHASSPFQRFYPYALLSSAPGVYSTRTVPFLDAQGVQFSLSNAVPVNGAAPSTGVLSNTISLFVSTTEAAALLVEGAYISPPLVSLQHQMYAIM